METAISTLSVLPSTKAEVATFVRKYKDELLAGTHDPLKQLVFLKWVEKLIGDILSDKEIDALMVREAEKYGKEKVIELNGAKLNIQETGTKYEYEACGDPVWNDLSAKVSELTEKKKERETFLKAIPYDVGIVEPETGVFITKPSKTSKTKVTVRLS
jgi:hypothetical protein